MKSITAFRKSLSRSQRRLAIISLLLTLTVLVGVFYSQFVPASWLRNFAEDIVLRAVIPEGQAVGAFSPLSGRESPASPHICLAKLTPFSWDRFYVVAPFTDLRSHPSLGQLNWPVDDLDVLSRRVLDDSRYQLLVFVHQNRVVEYEHYFTLWGDLSALMRTEGFGPESAVFTAMTNRDKYILRPSDRSFENCLADYES